MGWFCMVDSESRERDALVVSYTNNRRVFCDRRIVVFLTFWPQIEIGATSANGEGRKQALFTAKRPLPIVGVRNQGDQFGGQMD
jgi:hypothetical protein